MAVTKRYPKGKQRLFTNDLKSLLYAYGDSPTPNIETIHALEDALTSYFTDLIMEANKVRRLQKRAKFIESDYRFALRNDPIKLARFDDLASASVVLSKAQKLFDVNDVGKLKGSDKEKKVKKTKTKS
ncbi:hypothetical protein CANINC_003123 [Pichia inconspicua]|uniref:Transcription initiation factor TFIID subunit 13 n=1 Tax=Pichia inconspicua TaxID=52247 RepID=A0A4T0WZF3_9ASCO|nr:hypothetical protein CANINC_003123 [[Candida] inconspicua]